MKNLKSVIEVLQYGLLKFHVYTLEYGIEIDRKESRA